MSEYVCCWCVQYAYALTDIQRYKLVSSLAGINGAVKEYSSWSLVTTPSLYSVSPSADMLLRGTALHDSLVKLFGEDAPQVRGILRDIIMSTYEGERPEKDGFPDAFPGNDNFLEESFRPLFLDSLLLRREDIRAYCRKHEIRQVREVKGLLWDEEQATLALPHHEAQAEAEPQTHNVAFDDGSPVAPRKKKYNRGAIAANAAAEILGISTRQVQKWDAGENRPSGYPGRNDEAAFQLFANQWLQTKKLTEQARAMNRALSGGGLAEDADTNAFDEM
jgi:hypothetical protein